MRTKLILERINRTEEANLSTADIALLKKKRDKQLTFLLSAYIPLLAIGAFVLITGADSINFGHRRSIVRNTEETANNFKMVAPYVIAFFFVMANIYFGKLYFQSLRPL